MKKGKKEESNVEVRSRCSRVGSHVHHNVGL